MNGTLKFSILIITSYVIIFSGCVKKDFDTPPVIIPSVNFPSNLTIAQFKSTYSGNLDYIGDSVITTTDTVYQPVIQGIVSANDESGNIYKTLYIQDNTGGIQIALDRTSLYTTFKVGQRVFVKLKGMYMGNYGGVIQLGDLYNGAIGRLPDVKIDSHLFRDSLPGPAPVPLERTVSSLSGNDICMLVKLKKVHFLEAGSVYSDPNTTTNRTIVDSAGNQMFLRTSNYASFRGNLLPSGEGDLVGIYSTYNADKQFYIRDLNDLQNWAPDSMTSLMNESFATSLGTFTAYNVTGAEVWSQYTTPGAVTCAKMSGYTGTNNNNEDWLISPAFNFDNYSYETLSFQSAMKFGTPTDGSFKLYYSTNYTSGDPTLSTWTEVTVPTANLPAGADWNFVQSGNLDFSAATGSNVHIAIKYTSTTAGAATWEITDIKLKAKPN